MHDALEITARGLLAERSSGQFVPGLRRFAALASTCPACPSELPGLLERSALKRTLTHSMDRVLVWQVRRLVATDLQCSAMGRRQTGTVLEWARFRSETCNFQPSMFPMHIGAARIGLAVCVLVHVMFVWRSPCAVFGDASCRSVLEERSRAGRSVVQDARARVSRRGALLSIDHPGP